MIVAANNSTTDEPPELQEDVVSDLVCLIWHIAYKNMIQVMHM